MCGDGVRYGVVSAGFLGMGVAVSDLSTVAAGAFSAVLAGGDVFLDLFT